MKALLLCTLFAATFVQSATAQSVSGKVSDEEGAPVAHATVSLLRPDDSAWIRSEVTDAAGRYTIHAGLPGAYILQLTATGFAPQTRSISVPATPATATDFLLLRSKAALDGVTVTARKPFIEAKPGMMVVNVEGSTASAGSNALELLQRSPGVQVDPQGNVSMRGREGVQVYVDGRPSRLSGDQLTALLRAMTAEEIAQLELITQPSSKYEAAGTAGIINIRTRSIRRRGLHGNISATGIMATEPQGNLSARLAYRRNRLTLYASEYFNYVNNYNTLRVDRRYRANGTAEVTGNVLTEQTLNFNSRFHRMKGGGEYAVTDRTTVGARVQLPVGNPKMALSNLTTINDFPTATSTYTSGERSNSNAWFEREFGVLGRHRFKDDGELSLDAFTVYNHSADGGIFSHEERDGAGRLLSSPEAWDFTFPVDITLWSGQADYTRSLDKKTKGEAGIKYTDVAIDNQSLFLTATLNGPFVPDTLRTTRFLYNESVASAYLTLTRALHAKVELQGGLRAEQTTADGFVPKTGERFTRSYLSFFPTLFASWKADSQSTLTFSYGRRLDRPVYHLLNPSRDYIDRYSYRVGNPKLLPQFVNNLEIGYAWKGQLTITLSGTQITNVISDFFVQDDKTKTAYEIHDNIKGYHQAGLSLSYNRQPRPWWMVSLYGDAYFRDFRGDYLGTPYRVTGSSWSANCNNQLSLGGKWSAEISGWVDGPARNTVFTESAPLGSLDLGVSKKLLADSLVIKLAFNDVLGTQRYRGTNRFANFDTDVASTWDARRAVLSVNYSFGKSIDLLQRKEEGRRM